MNCSFNEVFSTGKFNKINKHTENNYEKLHLKNPEIIKNCFYAAVLINDVSMMARLYNDFDIIKECLMPALMETYKNDNLEAAQWLHYHADDNIFTANEHHLFIQACRAHSVRLVEWLVFICWRYSVRVYNKTLIPIINQLKRRNATSISPITLTCFECKINYRMDYITFECNAVQCLECHLQHNARHFTCPRACCSKPKKIVKNLL